MEHPVYLLSRSERKSLELVRSVVQLPHYLLIDDYDTCFDLQSLNKLSTVFEYAAKAGTTVLVTAKEQISSITNRYMISGGVIEKI
jgi:ABC-type lipopolysaccharide export system ATPase subunit